MSTEAYVLTEGGRGLLLCFIFYDGRRNWENGKRKLSVFPGIHYIQLLTLLWERLRPKKWLSLPHERLWDHPSFVHRWQYWGIHVTKSNAGQRGTFPTLQGIGTPLASWGPVALGLLGDSSLVWTLVFSWWSHQQSQQFHCVWGCISQGLEEGAAREEEGDNGRRYVENIVERPMRTQKALWSLLKTGKILSYPWMVSADDVSGATLYISKCNKCSLFELLCPVSYLLLRLPLERVFSWGSWLALLSIPPPHLESESSGW